MAQSFNFAILQAIPSRVRGERVNVGLVIATPDGIDLRVPELRKLHMLTGHEWKEIADAYHERLDAEWRRCADLVELRESLGASSEIFSLSEMGSIAGRPEEYEDGIKAILGRYVDRPKLSRRERQQRINYEIARTLRNAGILSLKGQTIEDHKVVRQFVISNEKKLVADFAYKNGSMKVVSTLDLRIDRAAHAQACEKGAILYFAKEKFGSTLRPFAVYAARPDEAEARKPEIEILSGFADGNAFNWLDIEDRQRFSKAFY